MKRTAFQFFPLSTKTFRKAESARALHYGGLVACAAVIILGFYSRSFAVPLFSTSMSAVKSAAANLTAVPAASAPIPTLLRKVAFVNPPDRECVRHYEKRVGMSPREFFRKYGATGTLHCPYRGQSGKTSSASGNFVCADNVLALHMHSFIDPDTGKIIAYPAECTVTLTGPAGKRMKPIHLTNDVIGDIDIFDKHLTDAKRKEMLEDPNVDWAVVRTREKAKGVTPYTVFDRNPLVASELADRQLISVSAPQEQTCRTISVGCGIRTTNNPRVTEKRPRGVFTDCDTSYGASGGADLQEIDGRMVIVGIHTADNHPGGENSPMQWLKDTSKNDFDPKKNATHSVVVERDFLNALAKMCGAQNITHLPPGNPYDETTDSEPATIGHK